MSENIFVPPIIYVYVYVYNMCHNKAMTYLLSLGASVDAPSCNRRSPLHVACEKQDWYALQILYQHGAHELARDEVIIISLPYHISYPLIYAPLD